MKPLISKFLSFLFMSLLLIGCAAPNVSKTITTEQLTAKNKALVVFSLTQPLGSETFGYSLFRFERDSAAGAIYAQSHSIDFTGLAPVSEFPNVYGRVGVIELPAGEYQLDAMFSNGQTQFSVRGKTAKNTIKVSAGEVVYVGSLNLHLGYGTNFLNFSEVVSVTAELKDEQTRDIPLFKAQYPALGQPQIRLFRVGPILPESR